MLFNNLLTTGPWFHKSYKSCAHELNNHAHMIYKEPNTVTPSIKYIFYIYITVCLDHDWGKFLQKSPTISNSQEKL